jgi:hypothetical protein
MGGYGSTRWSWHTKKRVVDNCLQLDILNFIKKGLISGHHASGTVRWDNLTGEVSPSITFEIFPMGDGLQIFRISYRVENLGEVQNLQYDIKLVSSRPYFGGRRWWFICPLIVNDRVCKRRVRVLYLPPSEIYFGCRHCHNLTYRSSQEHDKRVDDLLFLPAMELIDKMSEYDKKNFGLYLKALGKKDY